MIWIAVIDNERGILFNRRRQSQDKLLRERILKVTADSILWISPYTAIQFGEKLPKHVRIAENILTLISIYLCGNVLMYMNSQEHLTRT